MAASTRSDCTQRAGVVSKLELTHERPRTHGGGVRQTRDIQLSIQMRSDPGGQVAHPRVVDALLLREQSTVLGLSSWKPQEDTNVRAIEAASACPRSSSTSASDRSIPALTPAVV